MILTGKAKEDFEKWLLTDGNEIIKNGTIEYDLYYMCKYMIPQNMVNSKIIDWFDSVGIYINVSPNYLDHDRKYSEGDFKSVINFKNGTSTKSVDYPFEYVLKPCTRHQATEQAIIKANEIYNNR